MLRRSHRAGLSLPQFAAQAVSRPQIRTSNDMNDFVKAFLLATLLSLVITPVCIKLAPKIGAMDIPKDNRRVHKKPTPRFGGLAIYAGFISTAIFLRPLDRQLVGVYAAATLMLLVGMADDIWDIPAKLKLVGQLACGVILWVDSMQIRGMANFLPIGPEYISFSPAVSLVVTLIWIVAITNCINLIDGLDGLAAGMTLIASMAIAYISIYTNRDITLMLILGVAGACLGFLVFNFNPAKIFMGDSGSNLLGLLLASVSMIGDTPTKSVTLFATILPMIIFAVPIFDTVFAVVRRTIHHRSFLEADKGHLHHRILAMGFGQRRTVLTLYCICAIMGMAGILWTMKLKIEAIVLLLIASVLIFIFLGIRIDEDDLIAAREAAAHVNDPLIQYSSMEEALRAEEAREESMDFFFMREREKDEDAEEGAERDDK